MPPRRPFDADDPALPARPLAEPGPLRRLLQGLRGLGSDGDALPEGASAVLDVPYGPHPAQRLDVYRPAQPDGRVLALVHGGAWSLGDKAQPGFIRHKRGHWLEQGHIVMSVNYRLMPAARPLEQAADVAAAIAFVQSHAADWGGRPDRTTVMGHSTGAHLVALLAADASLRQQTGARDWLGTVLLDSATLDVERTLRGPHMPFHDRAFGDDPARWSEASPLGRLARAQDAGGGAPSPTLLVHSQDRHDSREHAIAFAEALRLAGGRAEVLSVPLGHAEINQQLGLPGPYTAQVDAFLQSLVSG